MKKHSAFIVFKCELLVLGRGTMCWDLPFSAKRKKIKYIFRICFRYLVGIFFEFYVRRWSAHDFNWCEVGLSWAAVWFSKPMC